MLGATIVEGLIIMRKGDLSFDEGEVDRAPQHAVIAFVGGCFVP
jgi:hypothetical protein